MPACSSAPHRMLAQVLCHRDGDRAIGGIRHPEGSDGAARIAAAEAILMMRQAPRAQAAAAARGRALDTAEPGGTAIRARGKVLILYSGPPGRKDGLAAELRRLGLEAVEIDIKVGGSDHDVTRADVADELRRRVSSGEFVAVFAGTPCESFSVARRPRLRTHDEAMGVSPTPAGWERYLAKHNKMTAFTIDIAARAIAAGVILLIENPAWRGDVTSPAFWARYAEHGSLWCLEGVKQLKLTLATTAMCRWGAPHQKWTTFGYNAPMRGFMGELHARVCTHAGGRHEALAHGRNERGEGLADLAAAYPAALCTFLAEAIYGAVSALLLPEPTATPVRWRSCGVAGAQPAWSSASPAAASANCTNGAMLASSPRSSSRQRDASNSSAAGPRGTGAPISAGSPASFSRRCTPQPPASSFRQTEPAPTPSGVTIPTPVTTTRCMYDIPSLHAPKSGLVV